MGTERFRKVISKVCDNVTGWTSRKDDWIVENGNYQQGLQIAVLWLEQLDDLIIPELLFLNNHVKILA